MPGMALGRVAAPINDEVGPIPDLAERARDLAPQLGGDFRWAVSERRMAVNHAAGELRQRDRFALRFTGDVA